VGEHHWTTRVNSVVPVDELLTANSPALAAAMVDVVDDALSMPLVCRHYRMPS
jgi:hypothetical protein